MINYRKSIAFTGAAICALTGSGALADSLPPTPENAIFYGNTTFLQVNNLDSRWLVAPLDYNCAGTADALVSDAVDFRPWFEWQFISVIGNGNDPEAYKNDPKRGECIRYGDTVYLHTVGGDPSISVAVDENVVLFLTGSRGEGNEYVNVTQYYGDAYEESLQATYQWIVRSTPGNGPPDMNAQNPDLGEGQCIEELAEIYLQNKYMAERWLTGGRGTDNSGVFTRNMHDNTAAAGYPDDYQWIVSSVLGNGEREGFTCAGAMGETVGKWVQIGYGSTKQTITYQEGTTISGQQSITSSSSWQASVTNTVEGGFKVAGVGAKDTYTVGAQYGQSMSKGVSETLSLTETVTETYELSPGVAWQWQYEASTICEADPFAIMTHTVVQTDNADDAPCCLPGYAQDPTQQHGPCLEDSPCFCTPDVCNGSNTRRLRGARTQ